MQCCSGRCLPGFCVQKAACVLIPVSDLGTFIRKRRGERWVCQMLEHFCFMGLSSPHETHDLLFTNGKCCPAIHLQ